MNSRGKIAAGWCFVPNETLVAGDVMLAQKIALETDEWSRSHKVYTHLALNRLTSCRILPCNIVRFIETGSVLR